MAGFSPKQRRFVAEYLKDQNGKQAAIRAGYSKKSAEQEASRLLRKGKVKAAVREKLAKLEEEVLVDKEFVLGGLKRIASVDLARAFDERGALKPIADIPEDIRLALAGIETDEIFENDGGRRCKVGETRKIRLADRVRCLELLGKHLALFTEKFIVADSLEKLLAGSNPPREKS